jgi:hypothetical protein
MELENKNKLKFLDIMIIRETKRLTFGTYRKPTATYTLIQK